MYLEVVDASNSGPNNLTVSDYEPLYIYPDNVADNTPSNHSETAIQVSNTEPPSVAENNKYMSLGFSSMDEPSSYTSLLPSHSSTENNPYTSLDVSSMVPSIYTPLQPSRQVQASHAKHDCLHSMGSKQFFPSKQDTHEGFVDYELKNYNDCEDREYESMDATVDAPPSSEYYS